MDFILATGLLTRHGDTGFVANEALLIFKARDLQTVQQEKRSER